MRDGKKEIDKERGGLLFTGSLLRCFQQLRLSQTEAKNWELSDRDLSTGAITCRLPGCALALSCNREKSQDSNPRSSSVGCRRHSWQMSAAPSIHPCCAKI